MGGGSAEKDDFFSLLSPVAVPVSSGFVIDLDDLDTLTLGPTVSGPAPSTVKNEPGDYGALPDLPNLLGPSIPPVAPDLPTSLPPQPTAATLPPPSSLPAPLRTEDLPSEPAQTAPPLPPPPSSAPPPSTLPPQGGPPPPPPPSSLPPPPRMVFFHTTPTHYFQGPTQFVVIPPVAPAAESGSSGWLTRLHQLPTTILHANRRPWCQPKLWDVLSGRQEAAKKEGRRSAPVIRMATAPSYVPASLTFAVLGLHRLLLHCLDTSFTVKQVVTDFLLLSLIREEVKLGVYSCPPQLSLQLKSRAEMLNNARDREAAMGVFRRFEKTWRHLRNYWRVRATAGCHETVEAIKDPKEEKALRQAADDTGALLQERFVCGSGALEDLETGDYRPPHAMTVGEAALFLLKSDEAFPVFTVSRPLESICLSQKYPVVFKKLSASIEVQPDPSRTVFVRKWAALVLNIPVSFAPPPLFPTDATAARQQQQQKEGKVDGKIHSGACRWEGKGTKASKLTYYQGFHTRTGVVLRVGDDAVVEHASKTGNRSFSTALEAFHTRLVVRVWELWEDASGKKAATVKYWRRRGDADTSEFFRLQPELRTLPWEVFATGDKGTVALTHFVGKAEVRTTFGTVQLGLPSERTARRGMTQAVAQARCTLEQWEGEQWCGGSLEGGLHLRLVCWRKWDRVSGLLPLPGAVGPEEASVLLKQQQHKKVDGPPKGKRGKSGSRGGLNDDNSDAGSCYSAMTGASTLRLSFGGTTEAESTGPPQQQQGSWKLRLRLTPTPTQKDDEAVHVDPEPAVEQTGADAKQDKAKPAKPPAKPTMKAAGKPAAKPTAKRSPQPAEAPKEAPKAAPPRMLKLKTTNPNPKPPEPAQPAPKATDPSDSDVVIVEQPPQTAAQPRKRLKLTLKADPVVKMERTY